MGVQKLLKLLSQQPSTATAFNPYFKTGNRHTLPYKNIQAYFAHFKQNPPSILLVGEAPGYKGCRITGIPFSSEKLIANWTIQNHLGLPVEALKMNQKNKYQSEATASIFWEIIQQQNLQAMAWNIYPFHPHKKDKAQSNRKPLAAEVNFGQAFLKELIKTFSPQQVVAIGKVAEKGMLQNGIDCIAIPHPSYGKKKAFAEGILTISTAPPKP